MNDSVRLTMEERETLERLSAPKRRASDRAVPIVLATTLRLAGFIRTNTFPYAGTYECRISSAGRKAINEVTP